MWDKIILDSIFRILYGPVANGQIILSILARRLLFCMEHVLYIVYFPIIGYWASFENLFENSIIRSCCIPVDLFVIRHLNKRTETMKFMSHFKLDLDERCYYFWYLNIIIVWTWVSIIWNKPENPLNWLFGKIGIHSFWWTRCITTVEISINIYVKRNLIFTWYENEMHTRIHFWHDILST